MCSKTRWGKPGETSNLCIDVSLIFVWWIALVPSHFLPLIPMLEDDLINSQRGFGGLRVLMFVGEVMDH